MTETTMLAAGDRYETLKRLGEGGMGAVYLAYAKDDPQRERPVALKVVLDIAKSKDAAARFKREILATSMCAHENIIEIYDAAETDDGSFYMAMECIEGEQLDELMKREGPVSVPRTVEFMDQAGVAVRGEPARDRVGLQESPVYAFGRCAHHAVKGNGSGSHGEFAFQKSCAY